MSIQSDTSTSQRSSCVWGLRGSVSPVAMGPASDKAWKSVSNQLDTSTSKFGSFVWGLRGSAWALAWLSLSSCLAFSTRPYPLGIIIGKGKLRLRLARLSLNGCLWFVSRVARRLLFEVIRPPVRHIQVVQSSSPHNWIDVGTEVGKVYWYIWTGPENRSNFLLLLSFLASSFFANGTPNIRSLISRPGICCSTAGLSWSALCRTLFSLKKYQSKFGVEAKCIVVK